MIWNSGFGASFITTSSRSYFVNYILHTWHSYRSNINQFENIIETIPQRIEQVFLNFKNSWLYGRFRLLFQSHLAVVLGTSHKTPPRRHLLQRGRGECWQHRHPRRSSIHLIAAFQPQRRKTNLPQQHSQHPNCVGSETHLAGSTWKFGKS